jgi:hypothetical protein
MRAFDVRIGNRKLAQILCPSSTLARELRKKLIAEGWPNTISVYRNNEDLTAYDDVSRYSKPEEH